MFVVRCFIFSPEITARTHWVAYSAPLAGLRGLLLKAGRGEDGRREYRRGGEEMVE